MINSLRPSDAYKRQYNIPTLVQIMACGLFGAKPLSEPMLPYCQLHPKEHISMKFYLKFIHSNWRKCPWKLWPFCLSFSVLTQVHTCFRGWGSANTETPSAYNTAVIHLIDATQWLNFNFSQSRECFLSNKKQHFSNVELYEIRCKRLFCFWNSFRLGMPYGFIEPYVMVWCLTWPSRWFKPTLIYHQWGSFWCSPQGDISGNVLRSIIKMCLKIMHLKLSPHLPGASALLIWTQWDHLSYLCECKPMLKCCSIQGVHIWFWIYTVVGNYIQHDHDIYCQVLYQLCHKKSYIINPLVKCSMRHDMRKKSPQLHDHLTWKKCQYNLVWGSFLYKQISYFFTLGPLRIKWYYHDQC